MRLLPWLAVVPACLAAQTAASPDPVRLLRDLRSAIQDESLTTAVELAAKLDEAVQQRYSAWLIRDAEERVGEALAWLPADTESVWVNQRPFLIRPEEGMGLLWSRPNEAYSVDRLAALNGGNFYRALAKHRIRLVVAGGRNIHSTAVDSVPARIAAGEVAYIFFLAQPIDFAMPDGSIQGRPVWRAVAKVDEGQVFQPGQKRAEREDENWLALARPDVVVLTNRYALLSEMLERATLGSKTRAMPADLPEWAHVDRHASFWGLRHYRQDSKQGEPGFAAPNLPHHPDGKAVGTTIRFDATTQSLEITYLSPAERLQRPGAPDLVSREFQIDQPEAGVWRLTSDVNARGPYPLHFGLALLGFGEYR